MGPEQMLRAANAAVDEAVQLLREADHSMFREKRKSSGEEVTRADVAVQVAIARELERQTPGIPLVGEESNNPSLPTGSYWLLDPIDGTMNAIRGAPYYAVSLAFIQDSEPVVGVIYAPALNQRRSAIYNKAQPTKQATPVALKQAIVGITGTRHADLDVANVVARIHREAYRIRMQGSMCLDLFGVASGWIDACVCIRPCPWDVAAGIVIARQTGHVVSGLGGDFAWQSPFLIAGSLPVTQELLPILVDWTTPTVAGQVLP